MKAQDGKEGHPCLRFFKLSCLRPSQPIPNSCGFMLGLDAPFSVVRVVRLYLSREVLAGEEAISDNVPRCVSLSGHR